MTSHIAAAVLSGAHVTIGPGPKQAQEIRVSVTKQTWNGIITRNQMIPVSDPETTEAAIQAAVQDMLERIRNPMKRR